MSTLLLKRPYNPILVWWCCLPAMLRTSGMIVGAWQTPVVQLARTPSLSLSSTPSDIPSTTDDKIVPPLLLNRRAWIQRQVALAIPAAATTLTLTARPRAANALVKGVAPPSPSENKLKVKTDKPKCTNIDECQALAEKRALEEQKKQQELLQLEGTSSSSSSSSGMSPIQKTPGGTRYRDYDSKDDSTGAVVVKEGDEAQLYYKVLKLGKRSYDGVSGEGTVVFSRGYGLEDDEISGQPKKSFVTTVGSFSNIAALNEALVGMHVGGTRRFAVLPQKGWRKADKRCDGGPGGSGTGGDVKTDFVVVPTAQLVAEEACFDSTKQPFPVTFAEQRRMAQRFDQSLIMEVQVISASPSISGL